MHEFRDFYGGDLLNESDIDAARTKAELNRIVENHRNHIEDMLCDANSHLDSFKRKCGLG